MKFICLGYADKSQFANMSGEDLKRTMDQCMDYDDLLRAGGHFLGGEALQAATTAVTLRYVGGKVQATDGPFAETKEQLGGILILEADSLEHAVELMSKHPGVKVGPFEIRLVDEEINKLIADRKIPSRIVETRAVSIIHRIGIKAPIAKVYEAISTPTGVASWWTREVAGESRVGSLFHVRFLNLEGFEVGSMDIRVVSLVPACRIQWYFESGPTHWIGTNVTFSLKREDEYTIVHFCHRGWREEVEFTAQCSMKWATFLLSLKRLLEDGRGSPSPNDVKIDNWNYDFTWHESSSNRLVTEPFY